MRVDMKIDVRGLGRNAALNPVIVIVRKPLALAQAIALTMFRDSPDELIVISMSRELAREESW